MKAAVRGLSGALAIAAILAATAEAGPLEEGIDAYHEKAYAKAAELWRPLAEAGNAPAQYLLGSLYVEGNGVEEDSVEALKWLELAFFALPASGARSDVARAMTDVSAKMTREQIGEA